MDKNDSAFSPFFFVSIIFSRDFIFILNGMQLCIVHVYFDIFIYGVGGQGWVLLGENFDCYE